MTSTNNFSLSGVGNDVRFGKGNGRIIHSGTGFLTTLPDGVTLTNISVAAPTSSSHATTKSYVDAAIGTAIGGLVGTAAIQIAAGTASLLLDGSTLSQSGTGLKVSTGGISNNEVAGNANIAYSKLNLAGNITNGDIAPGAAIDLTKLAPIGSAYTVLISDANGYITAANVDATELGYLTGLNGPIVGSLDTKLNLTGGSVSGPIYYPSSPIDSLELVNKAYVDLAVQTTAQGLDAKQSVRAATTANITLSNTQTIDGVALIAGNRVLVKNQTNATQNGIYVVAAGVWSRSTDMDINSEVTSAYVFVEEGSQAGRGYVVVGFTATSVIGTDAINWTQFSQAGAYTAGAGLTLTSGVFALGTSGVTAGTYTSVVVDSFGRVTVGGTATPQTITLTGDVTGSGTGTFTTTISTNSVTYAKIQQAANGSVLLGNASATAGNYSEIVLGNGLSITAGTLISTASGTGLIPYIKGAGTATNAGGTAGLAIGNNATVGGLSGIAIGPGASAGGSKSITIGDNTAANPNEIVIGFGTNTINVSSSGDISAKNLSGTNTGDFKVSGTTVPSQALALGANLSYSAGTLAVTGLGTLGTGSVTSVSVVTANGVSGSVATATSTPAITLTLGDITPNSVTATGTVSGSNLTGTNTGDQTIAISGDASGTGTGSIVLTLGSVVAAGTYNQVVVGTKGLVTSGTVIPYLTANQAITVTGDVTGSGSTALNLTLGTSGVTAGTYGNVTNIPTVVVNAKGLVTSVTNTPITYGTGSVTNIVAGSGLSGGTINNSGTIALNIASLGTASTVGTADLVAISQAGVTVKATVGDIVNLVSIAAPPATALYKEFYSANLTTFSQTLGTAPDLYPGIGGKVVVPTRVYFRVTSPFNDGTTALAKVVFTASNNTEQVIMTFDENDLSENGQYVAEVGLGSSINGQVASIQFFEADGSTPAIPTQGDGIVKITYDVIDNINNGSA